MNQSKYAYTSAVLFLAIAVVHGLRLVYGWHAQLGSFEAPVWFSWVALLVGLYMAVQGFGLSRKGK